MHGGQESTLLTMMIPLLHHGMIIVGLPYSESDLMSSTTGGSPYGVTHLAHADGRAPISPEEQRLAKAQGKRLAQTALKLLQKK
jgi:NAD(P)H dehydrogenase (quinone)